MLYLPNRNLIIPYLYLKRNKKELILSPELALLSFKIPFLLIYSHLFLNFWNIWISFNLL
jgi:hypothetical protein